MGTQCDPPATLVMAAAAMGATTRPLCRGLHELEEGEAVTWHLLIISSIAFATGYLTRAYDERVWAGWVIPMLGMSIMVIVNDLLS
jgi:hypothetical protein